MRTPRERSSGRRRRSRCRRRAAMASWSVTRLVVRHDADRDQHVIARDRASVVEYEGGHAAAPVRPRRGDAGVGAHAHAGASPALGQQRADLAAEGTRERRRRRLDQRRGDAEATNGRRDLGADQARARRSRAACPATSSLAQARGVVEVRRWWTPGSCESTGCRARPGARRDHERVVARALCRSA